MSSTFGMGHTNFHVTLFKALLSITRLFPPSFLGTTMIDAAAVNYLCIKEFVYLTSYPVIVLHSNGVWPL